MSLWWWRQSIPKETKRRWREREREWWKVLENLTGWMEECTACVWERSPLTSVEWPLRWGPRHPGASPSFEAVSGAIWLVKWTSNRRAWSNACSHIHTAHTQTYTHTQLWCRELFFCSLSRRVFRSCCSAFSPCSNSRGQTGTDEALHVEVSVGWLCVWPEQIKRNNCLHFLWSASFLTLRLCCHLTVWKLNFTDSIRASGRYFHSILTRSCSYLSMKVSVKQQTRWTSVNHWLTS